MKVSKQAVIGSVGAIEATTRGRTHAAEELDDYASDAAPSSASLVSHGSADWAA